MRCMHLIIGLGNPGDDYISTRHNVGFAVVEAFLNAQCTIQNGKWKMSRPLHAEIIECSVGNLRVILAKPTTFMNESGHAAAAIVKKYSPSLSRGDAQLVIVHDDLDLPLGTLRLSESGSSGGHKGVQSIIESLGTKDFLRLRIGIGPNATPDGRRIPAEAFVLKRFAKSERPRVDAAIAQAVEVLEALVRDGIDAARKEAQR